MKMKKLLTCVLAAVMVLSMAACGEKEEVTAPSAEETQIAVSDTEDKGLAEVKESTEEAASSEEVEEEEIYGSWLFTYDGSAQLSEQLGIDATFVFDLTLTFNEDGTSKIEFEEESIDAAMEQMYALTTELTIKTMYETLAENGYPTKEEADDIMMQTQGMDVVEYCTKAVAEQDLKSVFMENMDSMTTEGKFMIDGNKLYMASSDEAFDEYQIFEVKNNILTIFNEDGSEVIEGFGDKLVCRRK